MEVISIGMTRKIVGFSEAGYPIFDDELMDNYYLLIRAILKQARADYLRVYEDMLETGSGSRLSELQWKKDELEAFFASEWFETLVGTECPKNVITDMRRQAMEKAKEKFRKQEEQTL